MFVNALILGAFSFQLVQPPGCICFKHATDLVANTTKDSHLLRFCPTRVSRIVKPPVVSAYLPWERRTSLIGVSANGNYGLHLLR